MILFSFRKKKSPNKKSKQNQKQNLQAYAKKKVLLFKVEKKYWLVGSMEWIHYYSVKEFIQAWIIFHDT